MCLMAGRFCLGKSQGSNCGDPSVGRMGTCWHLQEEMQHSTEVCLTAGDWTRKQTEGHDSHWSQVLTYLEGPELLFLPVSVGVLQELPFRTCFYKMMLSVTFLSKLTIQAAAFSVCFREVCYESLMSKNILSVYKLGKEYGFSHFVKILTSLCSAAPDPLCFGWGSWHFAGGYPGVEVIYNPYMIISIEIDLTLIACWSFILFLKCNFDPGL